MRISSQALRFFPLKVRINVSSPGNGSVYSAALKPSTLSARSISGTFVLKLWRHGGHGEPLHWLRLTAALRLFIAQNLHWTQSRRSQRRVERGQKADGQGGDRNPYAVQRPGAERDRGQGVNVRLKVNQFITVADPRDAVA